MNESPSSSTIRRVSIWLLLVLGVAAAVAALVGAYSRSALVDADGFADRSAAALTKAEVRDRIATEVTDQLILEADRDLVAFRPLIQSAVAEAISSSAFRGLFRAAVSDFHRTAIGGEADTATVFIGDVGTVVSAAVESQYPELARSLPVRVPSSFDAKGTIWESDGWVRLVKFLSSVWMLSAAFGILCFTGATLISRDRRRTLVANGFGLAAAGIACVFLTRFLRDEAVSAFTSADDRAIAGVVFDAFLGDLAVWGLLTIAAGLVLAAACASLIRPVGLGQRMKSLAAVAFRRPDSTWARVLRALASLAAGAFLLLETRLAIELIVMLGGVVLVFVGIEELLRLVPEPEPEDESPSREGGSGSGRRWVPRRTARVAIAAALLVTLLGTGTAVTGSLELPEIRSAGTCNGSEELCDRRIDQVAMATTHNSMAAQTTPGWNFPQQETEIGVQLEDGVRGLMIDAYYGREVGNSVRTEIGEGEFRRNLEESFGGSAAAAAERIRDRLVGGNRTPGPREVWLCHGVCEVGAIRMKTALVQIRDFMARNPDEVITMIIQDEGVTPKDIEAEFAGSGLRPFVYDEPLDRDGMPTLRQMIDSGGRLLVFAENVPGGEQVPWLHDAFVYSQETPFRFTDRSQFSCRENRGEADAPLFVLNHWVDTSPAPRPSNAVVVNEREFLLDRARRCERERGRMSNLVAVDFYRTGDVFEVVDELNREVTSGS